MTNSNKSKKTIYTFSSFIKPQINVLFLAHVLRNVLEKYLYERIMYNRVHDFMQKENTLYDLQFGFRKGTSTTHELLNLVENIKKYLDNKKIYAGYLLIFKKPLTLSITKYYSTSFTTTSLEEKLIYGLNPTENKRYKLPPSIQD